MLSCPSSYEIYKTGELAVDWHEQPMNGAATSGIISPTQSRETGRQDRLTYAEKDGKLIEVYVDENGDVKKDLLLTLSNKPSTF